MGGSTPAKTEESKKTDPWAPATPLLEGLIAKYGGVNTDVTAGQTSALNNLQTAAGGIPNMLPNATGAVSNLFGSSTAPQAGMLSGGLDTLNTRLGGMANGNELNPYGTPGFADAIGTMTNDITDKVKGVYAAAGRDPSGAGSFGQSLGRGLTQGLSPVIQSQFNTNNSNRINAANTLFGANTGTATGINSLNQTQLQNGLSGLQGAGMLTALGLQPAQAQLAAATTAQNQPITNLQSLLGAGLGLAGAGNSSTGVSTQTPANNPFMNILGGLTTGAGLLFSDRRLKENERDVGMLFDGTPVKSYNYKGDDTPQIGLMAQDIERHNPDANAVHEVAGFKAVDYRAATNRAARMGMLEIAA